MKVMQKIFSFRSASGFVLVFFSVSALLIAGCDDTLNPITASTQQATLWGTMDMNSDVQRLRVVPIRSLIDARLVEGVDLELRTVDTGTGETVVWTGSTITFDDGTVGRLFEANLKVEPTHTYRIEVRSSAFPLVTTAETTIPAVPIATVLEEKVNVSTGPTGAVIRGTQSVVWNELSRQPFVIEQWYRFLEFRTTGFFDYKLPYDVPNSYDAAMRQLEMSLDLRRQHDTLDTRLSLDELLLVGLGETITLLDDEFVPPGGKFDPEVLAQPGTLSNVTNGFGFVGAVGRFSIEWVIADESASILTYKPLNAGLRIANPTGPGQQLVTVSRKPWASVTTGGS